MLYSKRLTEHKIGFAPANLFNRSILKVSKDETQNRLPFLPDISVEK